jgi:hypothetical protein
LNAPRRKTPAETRLLPDTPYFNFLRARRSIDPARFDSYHPRIGAILGLELTGIPTAPTRSLHANHRFNLAANRALAAQDPGRFAAQHPILAALFQLESPADGPPPTHLLPAKRSWSHDGRLESWFCQLRGSWGKLREGKSAGIRRLLARHEPTA